MRAWPVAARVLAIPIVAWNDIASEAHVSLSCRFIDSFGFEWQAHEVAVAPHAQRGEKSLYFFSRGATRVLSSFPADWSHRSWTELEDLCARARDVHRDGRADLHPDFRPTGAASS
jgi:hypothetical protein